MNIEETHELLLDYQKIKNIGLKYENIIPVVVQEFETKDVLVLAYVNQLALEKSLSSKIATFWSTSRNELWVKGATSGQYLDLVEARVNCEQNSLLFIVKIRNEGACHTKNGQGNFRHTCYYRKIEKGRLEFIKELK